MKSLIFILVLIPALVTAKKCTNPTGGTTARPATTQRPTDPQRQSTEPPVEETTAIEETTPDFPPPENWPSGKFGLMMAGPSCPDFFKFKKGWRYQDSEDYYNGNQWTQISGFSGKMKNDGYELHYCTKNKPQSSFGNWQAGDYCIHRFGNKCPKNFKQGYIKWDDENNFNSNVKKGTVPAGKYNKDTLQYFCCRNDSSADAAIDLPVTKPFYLYRFTSSCQKVRGMDVREEFIQFDDEDQENTNIRSGAHPYDSGNISNHKLHYCHYMPKNGAVPETTDVIPQFHDEAEPLKP